MKPTYTKLAADGTDLPADATGHLAVRVEHPLLAKPMIWSAHRSPKELTWKQAKKWAEKLDTYGWSWRLPTVEEAFLLCDRTRRERPMVDPAYFPDCDGEWIWTETEDLTAPAGFAWYVGLYYGGSDCVRQDGHGRVRAVRATDNKYPHLRSGTNLLTATEARKMLEHVLSRPFVGIAWLIETNNPVDTTLYYCGPGDWCSNPNHAMKWPSEESAQNSETWTQMQYPGNMRIAEHEWV